jgi:type IX secretion system PorP/SprF family membrane protein
MGLKLYAQDPHFSQFYSTPLFLAPSFAGTSSQKSRAAFNYRNQWPEVSQAFTTRAFSFDHFFSEINSGIGVLFTHDLSGQGNLSLINVGAQYSYDFQINREIHVRPGTHIYYTQRGIDNSKLIFYDQISENINYSVADLPGELKSDIDFATSVIAYSKTYWGGVTLDHLLNSNLSLYGNKALTPLKISVFGGYRLPLKRKLLLSFEESLTLAFLYNTQGDYRELQLGSYYHKNPLVFGMWYRGVPLFKNNFPGSDAIIFLMGYKIENVNVGYSYDFTISKLRNLTGGAHEISLVFNFKIKEWQKRPTSVPCPHF